MYDGMVATRNPIPMMNLITSGLVLLFSIIVKLSLMSSFVIKKIRPSWRLSVNWRFSRTSEPMTPVALQSPTLPTSTSPQTPQTPLEIICENIMYPQDIYSSGLSRISQQPNQSYSPPQLYLPSIERRQTL
jgi:hypothetical protein